MFCAIQRLMNIFSATNCYLLCLQKKFHESSEHTKMLEAHCSVTFSCHSPDWLLLGDIVFVGCYVVCLVPSHSNSTFTFSVNEIY